MADKVRVMVVEDEAIVSADIEMKLDNLGYSVAAVACSGEMALAKAQQVRPDLALMDVHLDGDMDGIETAAALRERFAIPVIYLTAFADGKTLDRAKATQPYGYIVKPFGERDLQVAIEMARYKYEAEREQRSNDQDTAIQAAVRVLVQRRSDLDVALDALERWNLGTAVKRKRGRPKGSRNRSDHQPTAGPVA